MNREQRRAQDRAARQAQSKLRGTPPAADAEKREVGAEILMQTIMQNRYDAVMRVVNLLFEAEVGSEDKLWRLTGLGGATGVVTLEKLNEAANAAIGAAMLLPGQLPTDEAEPPMEEAPTSTESGGSGGTLDELELAFQRRIPSTEEETQ